MTALEARKLAEEDMRAGKTPSYTDLREWLEIVDSFGELKKVDGVDWNLEMGTLSELIGKAKVRCQRFYSTTLRVIPKATGLFSLKTLPSSGWP
jgi:hypothetical protein